MRFLIAPALFLLMQSVPCNVTSDVIGVQTVINAAIGVAMCPVGPIVGTSLTLTGPGPSRFFFAKGPAPTDTTDTENGVTTTYDAVLFMDQADGKLKVRFASGTIAILAGP